jgi:hypothetical protein
MALFIAGTFYATMVLAGYVIEVLFSLLHLIPAERAAKVTGASVSWNYTSFLNIVLLLIATALIYRFICSGGLAMLKMMNSKTAETPHSH